jgi:hypothetical protein
MLGTLEAWTSWSVLEVDHLIVWNIIEACVFEESAIGAKCIKEEEVFTSMGGVLCKRTRF